MSDARFKKEESIVLKGIRSVICVPVLSQGELNGVLYLSTSRVKQPFVEQDLEVCTAAGTLLGLTTESLEAARVQREMFLSAVRTLVALLELVMKGSARRGHAERVAAYAEAVAKQLGLAERERTAVRMAALLHDIGKTGLAEETLTGKETRSTS
jgi:HD-GYP domain-containing protein (c-di-GMP phosphodiesterase class II)